MRHSATAQADAAVSRVGPADAGPTETPPMRPAVSWRRRWAALGATGTVVVLFLATLAWGSVTVPLPEVLAALAGNDLANGTWRQIVVELRLPRAITATLAGAALGVGGLLMQTLFRNPLASPGTLGITAGASLGAAAVVLAGGVAGTGMLVGLGALGRVGTALAAIAGAIAVMAVLLVISQRVHSGLTLILLGLMIGYAVSALVSVLIYLSDADRIQGYITWTLGTFARTTLSDLAIVAPVVAAGLVIGWLIRDELNVLLLGDRYAATMGTSVRRVRVLAILSASALAGVITAFSGPVIFVGVAAPHIARGLFGTADHRVLVPGVIVVGAAVALLAGFVASLPGSDQVLPVNAITPLIGAPVVIAVLRSRRLARAMAQ